MLSEEKHVSVSTASPLKIYGESAEGRGRRDTAALQVTLTERVVTKDKLKRCLCYRAVAWKAGMVRAGCKVPAAVPPPPTAAGAGGHAALAFDGQSPGIWQA